MFVFFCFKQKTAYEMRISDWSSDVCSSDLLAKETRADADDDREHHHLDAGRHDIAEDALGEERGLVPEREGHQDEAGQRRQLEFQDGDEEQLGSASCRERVCKDV